MVQSSDIAKKDKVVLRQACQMGHGATQKPSTRDYSGKHRQKVSNEFANKKYRKLDFGLVQHSKSPSFLQNAIPPSMKAASSKNRYDIPVESIDTLVVGNEKVQ